MKRLLLALAFLAGASLPAAAQSCITDASGNTVCDPTAFHVTAPGATGTSPVFLNNDTTFSIVDNSGATIDEPLTVYFAVPVGDGVPDPTSWSFNGGTSTAIPAGSLSNEGVWTPGNGKGQDLYSFVNAKCGCDPSINQTNVDAVDGTGTKFNVYNLVIDQSFAAKDDTVTVDGLFANGTIIAPLAENVVTKNGKTTTTFFDTSWTNTGFVNTGAVPEPKTWAMGLMGFAFVGLMGWRKARHTARFAFEA